MNSVLAELELTNCDIGADGAKARPACLRQSNSQLSAATPRGAPAFARPFNGLLEESVFLFGGFRREDGRRRVPSSRVTSIAVVGS